MCRGRRPRVKPGPRLPRIEPFPKNVTRAGNRGRPDTGGTSSDLPACVARGATARGIAGGRAASARGDAIGGSALIVENSRPAASLHRGIPSAGRPAPALESANGKPMPSGCDPVGVRPASRAIGSLPGPPVAAEANDLSGTIAERWHGPDRIHDSSNNGCSVGRPAGGTDTLEDGWPRGGPDNVPRKCRIGCNVRGE